MTTRPPTEEELEKRAKNHTEHLRNQIKLSLQKRLEAINFPGPYPYNWTVSDDLTTETIKSHVEKWVVQYEREGERLSWMPQVWEQRYRDLNALDHLFIAV
jgi:hypothetical protein